MKVKTAKIISVLVSVLILFASCGQLAENGGESQVTISFPYVAGANSRAIDPGKKDNLQQETKSYRIHMNNTVLEGTGGNFSAYFVVGIRLDIYVECLNSNRDVIVRTATKSIIVSSGQNSVDFNLVADGNEIIPASQKGRVTYSYGEAASRPEGERSGLPTDDTSYSLGELFTVKGTAGITWDHGTFTGWKSDKMLEPELAGSQPTDRPTAGNKYKMPEGGVVLTAEWQKNQYTITYDLDKPTNATVTPSRIDDVTQDALTQVTLVAAPTVNNPVTNGSDKKNYTFVNWKDTSDGDKTYNAGAQITLTKDMTLVAVWSDEAVYTITFDQGSVTSSTVQGLPSSLTVISGQTSQAWTNPTAAGYTFSGWKITTTAGGGVVDADAGTITSYAPTDNVTLTARWTINSYQVTYALDGGSGGPAGGNVQYNASASLDAPTKTGYNFMGWSYNGATYGGTSGSNSLTMPAQAITLTAQWILIQYNITYSNTNGGTGSASTTGATTSFNIETPSITLATEGTLEKIAYRFGGWETADGTNRDVSNMNAAELIALITSGDTLALQVKWIADKRTCFMMTEHLS